MRKSEMYRGDRFGETGEARVITPPAKAAVDLAAQPELDEALLQTLSAEEMTAVKEQREMAMGMRQRKHPQYTAAAKAQALKAQKTALQRQARNSPSQVGRRRRGQLPVGPPPADTPEGERYYGGRATLPQQQVPVPGQLTIAPPGAKEATEQSLMEETTWDPTPQIYRGEAGGQHLNTSSVGVNPRPVNPSAGQEIAMGALQTAPPPEDVQVNDERRTLNFDAQETSDGQQVDPWEEGAPVAFANDPVPVEAIQGENESAPALQEPKEVEIISTTPKKNPRSKRKIPDPGAETEPESGIHSE